MKEYDQRPRGPKVVLSPDLFSGNELAPEFCQELLNELALFGVMLNSEGAQEM